jgi:hypothetical protein
MAGRPSRPYFILQLDALIRGVWVEPGKLSFGTVYQGQSAVSQLRVLASGYDSLSRVEFVADSPLIIVSFSSPSTEQAMGTPRGVSLVRLAEVCVVSSAEVNGNSDHASL